MESEEQPQPLELKVAYARGWKKGYAIGFKSGMLAVGGLLLYAAIKMVSGGLKYGEAARQALDR